MPDAISIIDAMIAECDEGDDIEQCERFGRGEN